MRKGKQDRSKGSQEFFLIALSHETLKNYFELNFVLLEEYKYSLFELESMIPWEREIYISMLSNHEKEKRDARGR